MRQRASVSDLKGMKALIVVMPGLTRHPLNSVGARAPESDQWAPAQGRGDDFSAVKDGPIKAGHDVKGASPKHFPWG
jgi:hypothetical protein